MTIVPRGAKIAEVMRHAVDAVGRLPLRDLVERTWMALGGPATLREPNHLEDAQTYLDLLGRIRARRHRARL